MPMGMLLCCTVHVVALYSVKRLKIDVQYIYQTKILSTTDC